MPHRGDDRLDRILALVRAHRPRLRLVDRHDVGWMRTAGELLHPVAGPVNERFTTVIGDTVYLPRPPDRMDRDQLAATLAHELVHQLDQARYGPWFFASYAFGAPAVRTARAHWERRAYAVDLLLAYEAGGEPALRRQTGRIAELFSGPSYGWMWAGADAARRYLEPVVQGVLDGSLARTAPYDAILAAWRGTTPPEDAA